MGYANKATRPSMSRKEAKKIFYVVMEYFGHSADTQAAAWKTYLAHPRRGYRCYKAIYNSLVKK